MRIDPEDVVEFLTAETRPYFWWLSDLGYNPVFMAGGEPVSAGVENDDPGKVKTACVGAVETAISSGGSAIPRAFNVEPEGVILAVNAETIGPSSENLFGRTGGMTIDSPCLEAEPADECDSFPSNGRYVMVAGGRVDGDAGGLPLLVPHEMGHALGFAHSHTSMSENDNPMDVMSDAVFHFGKTRVGTLAVNRYQAGWVDPGRVRVHGSGTVTYALLPPGVVRGWSLVPSGVLPEMLAIEGKEGVFASLGARVAKGYDSELTATPTGVGDVAPGREGVEAYLVDQRTGHCITLYIDRYGACVAHGRETAPIPRSSRSTDPVDRKTDHVYQKDGDFSMTSDQFTGSGLPGLGVEVVERVEQQANHVGDVWLVRVSEPGDPGPFGDIGGNDHLYRIELLKWLGITAGCGTGVVYCPSRVTPREEMAVFVVRALGEEPVPLTDGRGATFADVPRTSWAWGYIEKLHDLGLTDGCGRTTPTRKFFCPYKNVTKAQTAVFLVRAMTDGMLPASSRRTFADVPTSHFAHRYIEKLHDLGLARPTTTRDGRRVFSPASTIPRDSMARWLTQAAVMLQGVPTKLAISDVPPGQPQSVVVSHPWVVSWKAPAKSGTGGVRGYHISYGVVGGDGWIASTGIDARAHLYRVALNNRGQQLYVRVRAYNYHGASAWTARKTFDAPPPGLFAPPPPTDAAAVSTTSGEVTLTWKPPTITASDSATHSSESATSDSGTPDPSAISGYRILRKQAGGDDYHIIVSHTTDTTDTTYTDTGVPPGQHTYQIFAVNNAGLISTQGSDATVTVQPQPTTTTTSTSTTTTSTTTTKPAGITISVADATATEGGVLEFTVTLSEEPYQFVTVNYDSHDGTATQERDYYRVGATLIIDPGQTSETIKIRTKDDTTTEDTETFQLVLTQPHGATLARHTATGTIHDDD